MHIKTKAKAKGLNLMHNGYGFQWKCSKVSRNSALALHINLDNENLEQTIAVNSYSVNKTTPVF